MDNLENITYNEIKLGDTCQYTKTLTEKDLILFAEFILLNNRNEKDVIKIVVISSLKRQR